MGRSFVFFLAILAITAAARHPVKPQKQANGKQLESNDEGNRIIGGNEVDAHSIPHQVALIYKYSTSNMQLFCGGTILSATKILTAAHCFDTNPPLDRIYVVVGEHSLISAADGVVHYITSIVKHPDYTTQGWINDIAIITLDTPIELGDKAKAACLPTSEMNPLLRDGTTLTVSGWGTRKFNTLDFPTALHGINVPFIRDADCLRAYGPRNYTRSMICAGNFADGGIDSCTGDSGGPLTYTSTSGAIVVGVVSWGAGCGDPKKPGVYAKVSTQLQWLKDQGVENACGGNGSGGQEPTPGDCTLALVGDGFCNAGNNHPGCFFDGNDCCTDSKKQFCKEGESGCQCVKDAFDKCPSKGNVNDGFCDGGNNIPECNYDGGDCCTRRGLFGKWWNKWCKGDACNCIMP